MRPLLGFRLRQRNARPPAHGTAQNLLHLIMQDHLIPMFPLFDGGMPLPGCQIGKLLDLCRAHQRYEHLLSLPMGLSVHQLHASFILQQHQRRWRHGMLAGMVEHPGRFFSHGVNRLAKHQLTQ